MAAQQSNTPSARTHALAVLRIRSAALGVALLPAAAAVILLAADATGRTGEGWDTPRGALTGVALLVLAVAAAIAVTIARARPALTPTVPVEERSAPALYRLVRDLAERLGVPAPSSVALTPDCDSWLEDRTHRAHGGRGVPGPDGTRGARTGRGKRSADAPVLVIGSPFLWWMRVAELRALLAPVVAGTGPSAHPDIAAARRFVRGLDAAAAVVVRPPPHAAPGAGVRAAHPARRCVGRLARVMLRACGPHAAEMERGVAAAASDRAQNVDYGLRITAQEQVGLAYAGWDRLLTRVALPAWRIGRWPSRLDAGVVSALAELSRRDRLAEGFTSRLGEAPACDLLEEPGRMDAAVSLLAARLFHGCPYDRGGTDGEGAGEGGGGGEGWTPVDWSAYPEEVVDRLWRRDASRLFDALGATDAPWPPESPPSGGRGRARPGEATLARVMERLAAGGRDALAAWIGGDVARAEAARSTAAKGTCEVTDGALIPGGELLSPMGLLLQPPRSARELLAEHVTAVVCCAAVDTAGAAPGLDWLDGPVLLVGDARVKDLSAPVLGLVEDGDPRPLRDWLACVGVRTDKPVRLV